MQMNIVNRLAVAIILFIGLAACTSDSSAQTTLSAGEYEAATEDLWCQRGSNRIYGVLYRPLDAGTKLPLVIMAHGFGGTHGNVRAYAEAVSRKGFLCYCLDFCGGGNGSRSDGSTTEMSIFTEREDLTAVVGQLKSLPEVDSSRIILMGESQGGMVSAITASQMPDEILCLALFYPAFCIPDDAKQRYPTPADIPNRSSPWGTELGRAYYEGLYDFDVYAEIGKFTKPVLLLHGDRDNIVDISYAQQAAETYQQVEYHVLHGAGHGFYGSSQTQAIEYLQEWLERQVQSGNTAIRNARVSPGSANTYNLTGMFAYSQRYPDVMIRNGRKYFMKQK